jgi:glutamate dehydrogenase (NAD(P)+)
MEKRFEEQSSRRLLAAVERLTDRRFTPGDLGGAVRGANEEDLVNSGLEETMVQAYRQIRETRSRHGNKIDLRTAAFVNAIDKIALCYEELGIFP